MKQPPLPIKEFEGLVHIVDSNQRPIDYNRPQLPWGLSYLPWRLGLFIADLPKEVGWWWGGSLTGFSLSRKRDAWLLTVKLTKNDEHYVVFQPAKSILDCFWTLASNLKKNQLPLRVDKWKKGLDKSTSNH